MAYQSTLDVDKSYVRCLNILMSGEGYPMLATHDPRLVAIGEDRAKWFDRSPDDVRVPDAVRDPPGRAAPARRRRLHGAGLRPVRRPSGTAT